MRHLFVLIVFTLFAFERTFATEGTPTAECLNGVAQLAKKAKKIPKIDPIGMVTGRDVTVSEGGYVRRWDDNLRTMVYHTASEPNADGSFPLIDPNAKAVVVYFHGSGTKKASGRNFIHNGNAMAARGISVVAPDLPYHADSKPSTLQKDLDYYMIQMHGLLSGVKASGKKVILFGHSYGPEFISEYVKRFPKDVDEIILASPAPSHSPSHQWMYQNVTDRGRHLMGGDAAEPNEAGGLWAGQTSDKMSWHLEGIPENIKVKIVVGNKDEWWPPQESGEKLPSYVKVLKPKVQTNILGNSGIARALGVTPQHSFNEALAWLRERVPHAEVNVIDGYGHMIFEAEDSKGQYILNQMIFDSAGIDSSKKPAKEDKTARLQVALLGYHNAAFRKWVGEKNLPKVVDTEKHAAAVLNQWKVAEWQVWRDLMERMAEDYPDYYAKREFFVGRTLQQIPKSKGEFLSKSWDVLAFQADFKRYLENKAKGIDGLMGPDPLRPKPWNIDTDQMGEGAKYNLAKLPIRAEDLKAVLTGDNQFVSEEPLGNNLVRVRFLRSGKPEAAIAFSGLSESQVQSILNDAYLEVFREPSDKKEAYASPPSRWKGKINGVQVEATNYFNKETGATYLSNIVIAPAK